MDPRYGKKVVNLPDRTKEQLEAVREQLAQEFGFAPSLTETIQFLILKYQQSKEGPTPTPEGGAQ